MDLLDDQGDDRDAASVEARIRPESGAFLDPADRGGCLTYAGRALQKHASRGDHPQGWPAPERQTPAEWNRLGQETLNMVVSHPDATRTPWRGRVDGVRKDVVDVRLPDGRGARFSTAGQFITFLD